jgi:hypothetical protein
MVLEPRFQPFNLSILVPAQFKFDSKVQRNGALRIVPLLFFILLICPHLGSLISRASSKTSSIRPLSVCRIAKRRIKVICNRLKNVVAYILQHFFGAHFRGFWTAFSTFQHFHLCPRQNFNSIQKCEEMNRFVSSAFFSLSCSIDCTLIFSIHVRRAKRVLYYSPRVAGLRKIPIKIICNQLKNVVAYRRRERTQGSAGFLPAKTSTGGAVNNITRKDNTDWLPGLLITLLNMKVGGGS